MQCFIIILYLGVEYNVHVVNAMGLEIVNMFTRDDSLEFTVDGHGSESELIAKVWSSIIEPLKKDRKVKEIKPKQRRSKYASLEIGPIPDLLRDLASTLEVGSYIYI